MKYIAWIGLFGLLSVGSVCAQSNRMRSNIPFNFIAGDRALPAGEYRVDIDPMSHRLTLSQADGSIAMVLPAHLTEHSTGASVSAKLVFHQYGKTCFLRSAWQSDQSVGYEVAPSKHEREMAKTTVRVELASVLQ